MKLKKDFELSLWEDFMDTINGKQFINERKVCTIASQTFDSPSAAYNVVFKSKTNGTHELSFDINYRYWDQAEQDFVENPFRKYLFNEAKVKLKYKGEWFDFVIKNCSENSKEKKFSYSCKDLYIDELGRNGYSVEFSTSLGGNVGDVTELAATTLENSDWQVSKDSVVPVQKVEEAVYAYTLPDKKVIQYQEINEDGTKGNVGEIRNTQNDDGSYNNKTIFILYSCANNEDCKDVDYQFYYNEDEKYEVNDDGFFIHTNVKFPTKIGTIKEEDGAEVITWQEKNRIQFSDTTHTFNPGYRGYRYVRSQKVEWLPKIGKMVNIYKRDGQEYYGYQKTTYLSPEIAQNVLINSSFGAFDGTSGWRAFSQEAISNTNPDGECQIELGGEYDYDENSHEVTLGGNVYLKAYYYDSNRVKHYPTSVSFFNSAFEYNLKNIGAITKGEKWVCRIPNNWLENGTWYPDIGGQNYFSKEWLPSNVEIPASTPFYYYVLYVAEKSLTYEELLNDPLTCSFLCDYGEFYGAEFFRYYTYKNEKDEEILITPETEIDVKNLIKNEYYYFTKEQYEACRNEDDLEISFMESDEPQKSTFIYNDPEFKKVITLETKESNYYNIIQTLNEKFDCWADFQIEHNEDGSTVVDDNGRRKKWVIFKNYIGKENWSGFKYGINLDGIQRTIDSEEITTKTIVKPNSNEFGKNGFCTIARAKGNPTGSNAIINLDYFIRQGVLEENEVRGDLYVESTAENPTGTLGYYARLKRLNDGIQEIEQQLIGIDNAILKANTVIQSNDISEEEFAEDMKVVNEKLAGNIIKVDGKTPIFAIGDEAIFFKNENGPNWGINTLPIREWAYKSPINFYRLADEKNIIYEKCEPSNNIIYNLTHGRELVDNYNKFIKDRYYATENKRKLEIEKAILTAFRDGKYSYVDVDGVHQYYTYENGILKHGDKIITNDIIPNPAPEKPLSQQVKELEKEFYSKYYRFIREGTWTSEDYTDDELYYYDACSVSYTSAFPKTTYSISVVDIKNAVIPDELGYDYSNYDFNCGDLTTVEDTEFFGWTIDNGKKRPYREIVVISETEEHLDNPDGDKITIQNYKTQFDDLFQRMAAATQTLELKEGVYDRAGNAVNLNGTINKVLLQNTLYNNELVLQNAGAQNLEWSDRGIIAQDLSNQAYVTRIVGGGILVSEDGGKNWSVGISGKGINASNIKTGQLDVGKIRILSGNDPCFSWGVDGINGYDKNIDGSYSFNKYTRMDRFGFYAVNNLQDYVPVDDDDIWDNNKVLYCLTKHGLRLGVGNSSIRMEKNADTDAWEIKLGTKTTIDADGKIQISADDLDMQLTANNIEFTNLSTNQKVQMGTGNYALWVGGAGQVINTTNKGVFSVDYDGWLTAKKGTIGTWSITENELSCERTNTNGTTSIMRFISDPNNYDFIYCKSGDDIKFTVNKDGKLYCQGAVISGDSTFEGIINAKEGGTIAGWSINKNSIQYIKGGEINICLNTNEKEPVMYCTQNSIDDAFFRINRDGTIMAKNAEISGTLKAGSIIGSSSSDGMVGKTKISNLYLQTLGKYGGIFQVYKDSNNTAYIQMNNSYISMYATHEKGGAYGHTGLSLSAIAKDNAYGQLSGTWNYGNKEIATTGGSDIRLKHSIQSLSEIYDSFYDKLNPVTFIYNKDTYYNLGTSQRTHIGFIANEVENSLISSGLTAQEFAGYILQQNCSEFEDGTRFLKYDEFIALNTWQIQKLKTRVTELENEIQSLKQKLS